LADDNAKKRFDPDVKMPSTQRRKEAKAQSIFIVMGAGRHVA
jgi:hypothetical protein